MQRPIVKWQSQCYSLLFTAVLKHIGLLDKMYGWFLAKPEKHVVINFGLEFHANFSPFLAKAKNRFLISVQQNFL